MCRGVGDGGYYRREQKNTAAQSSARTADGTIHGRGGRKADEIPETPPPRRHLALKVCPNLSSILIVTDPEGSEPTLQPINRAALQRAAAR